MLFNLKHPIKRDNCHKQIKIIPSCFRFIYFQTKKIITNSYFTRHKKNGVCIKTNASKKLSAECGAIDTTRQEDLICKISGIKNKRNNRNGAGSSTE